MILDRNALYCILLHGIASHRIAFYGMERLYFDAIYQRDLAGEYRVHYPRTAPLIHERHS